MQQTILALSKEDYEKANFINSDANHLAYKIIEYWPQNGWGVEPYKNSLLLKGPASSGKTFLAHNWAHLTNAKFIDNKLVTSEELASYNCFIIEDIDQIADEEMLLHNFNIINECDKFLLMTCKILPQINLRDLCSRVRAVNVIEIAPPDDKLINILIFKFFSEHSVKVPHQVVKYLVRALPRRFDLIREILTSLNNYSLENQHKITIPMIKKVMIELDLG